MFNLIFLIKNIININNSILEKYKNECNNKKIITFLNHFNFFNFRILSIRGNICHMTENNNCKHIYEWEKEEEWEEFYKKKNIDFVLIEDALINDFRFKSDKGFLKFIAEKNYGLNVCKEVTLIPIR